MSTSEHIAKRICLGTAQIGLDYGIANNKGRPDDRACERLLARAVERGVLRWDTARNYGDAEQRIGRFLSHCGLRDEVQIVSKLAAPPSDLPASQLMDWVTAEVETSLNELGIQQLHGWLVHDAATVRKYGSRLWDAMCVQVDRDVVRQIGVSVYNEDELRLGLDCPQTKSVQVTLNLFDHRFPQSGLLAECTSRDVTVYARSVLLQGTFTIAKEEIPPSLAQLHRPLTRLFEILSGYDLQPLDAALPFVLSHDQVNYAVIGVDDVVQLDDNLARAERTLPDGLVDELRAVFANMPLDVIEPRRWTIE